MTDTTTHKPLPGQASFLPATTPEDLLELVLAMRASQRACSLEGPPDVLVITRALERQVDALCRKILQGDGE